MAVKRTIKETHEALVNKTLSVRELVDEYLAVIEETKDLNAYLEVYKNIDEQVEAAQKRFDEGSATLLTGIPIALKDNILLKGEKASAASKMLENYTATYDATIVARLKEQSPIFLGRANMDEFAMGSSGENSAFGATKNPHDSSKVPGGSSSGPAAITASGAALASLGTDTGGSIRQPASFCGCVGFKPTYGRLSRSGLIAMGSSFDQAGPLTNSVEDAEILFEAMQGVDVLDSTTLSPEIVDSYVKETEGKTGKVIGVPTSFIENDGIDAEVRKNFEESLDKLKEKGYEVKSIDLDILKYALPIYYILMPAEVSSNLARFDGLRYGSHVEGKNLLEEYVKSRGEGFGEEVRRRILLGTYVLSSGYYDAYYGRAEEVRNTLRNKIKEVFADVDIIATPTSPVLPFSIGEKSDDPLTMYLADIFTIGANLSGGPALSVPSGMSAGEKPLPMGIQFMAPHCREDLLFSIGKDAYEI
jgi:aspartyl-tRNA(Asn)/glutamyl-tRNA(Gln) amidotransferase subunit A